MPAPQLSTPARFAVRCRKEGTTYPPTHTDVCVVLRPHTFGLIIGSSFERTHWQSGFFWGCLHRYRFRTSPISWESSLYHWDWDRGTLGQLHMQYTSNQEPCRSDVVWEFAQAKEVWRNQKMEVQHVWAKNMEWTEVISHSRKLDSRSQKETSVWLW